MTRGILPGPSSAPISARFPYGENLNPKAQKALENCLTRFLLMVIQLEASTAQNSSLKEEEMEVDLELSVGGSFRNLETSKPKIDSKLELCSCSRSEDAKAKREIQALRRQEAKKKREKKKGMRNGGGVGDERMRLEAQRLQSRVKDRERRENNEANLTHHKSYINHRNHGIVEGPIQMMVPIKYAHPSKVQYVPLAFPCVVPCGAPATWLQPVKSLPVRQGCGGRSVLSDGWTNSSASVSHQDSGSSDIGSLSSHTRTEPPQRSEAQGQSEHSVSSCQKDSSQGTSSDKSTSFGEKVSTPVKDPTTRRNSSTGESPPSPLKKARDGNGDLGEPPRPRNQNHHRSAPSLEQMPCVSTTGNGPNGKTITGFLYRYTKAEISIVCVCHGSSFSPAGFVEHAGGIDVSHPLRHITVIPSAFA